MLLENFRRRHWKSFYLLSGGLLFQVAGITCNQLAADLSAGLATSIANQFIRNIVYDALGLGPGGGFGGLGGLGT